MIFAQLSVIKVLNSTGKFAEQSISSFFFQDYTMKIIFWECKKRISRAQKMYKFLECSFHDDAPDYFWFQIIFCEVY